MEPLLICTDLDRTLIPNGVQPESHDARRRFSALISQPDIKLAYVSGRHRDLVYQLSPSITCLFPTILLVT